MEKEPYSLEARAETLCLIATQAAELPDSTQFHERYIGTVGTDWTIEARMSGGRDISNQSLPGGQYIYTYVAKKQARLPTRSIWSA